VRCNNTENVIAQPRHFAEESGAAWEDWERIEREEMQGVGGKMEGVLGTLECAGGKIHNTLGEGDIGTKERVIDRAEGMDVGHGWGVLYPDPLPHPQRYIPQSSSPLGSGGPGLRAVPMPQPTPTRPTCGMADGGKGVQDHDRIR
jgi:hypothetical protein